MIQHIADKGGINPNVFVQQTQEQNYPLVSCCSYHPAYRHRFVYHQQLFIDSD
jgi:hypothetical protein